MAQNERFKVSLVLKIEGDKGFSASTEQHYADMSYDQMQVAQRTILKGLVKSLLALGDAKVTDKAALALADTLV
jgi:hypothetical protein